MMTTASVPSLRRCTVGQLKRLLRYQLHLLWSKPQHASVVPPLMIWGPPGVGKSAVIEQVSSEEGIGFLDVRLAQREPVDIRGLPVPREDGVHWLTAAEWPRAGRGIILFDELTAADRSLQVAAYEFILDRRLGDLYRVPEGWYICAAGNRSQDRAATTTLSTALANRFCHLEVEADLEDWASWAISAGLRPEVIAFLRFRPDLLLCLAADAQMGWPSPRSWERVSLELEYAESAGLDSASLYLVVQGLVGPAACGEFFAFLSWFKQLPEVRAMLRGEIPVAIPERADQKYALASAAAQVASREPELLGGLLSLTLEMTSDFAVLAVLDYLNAEGEGQVAARVRELVRHPRFSAWRERHGRSLVVRLPSLASSEGR